MDNPEGKATYHRYSMTTGLPTSSSTLDNVHCVFIFDYIIKSEIFDLYTIIPLIYKFINPRVYQTLCLSQPGFILQYQIKNRFY